MSRRFCRRSPWRAAFVAIPFALASVCVHAQAVSDSETGLVVTPPPGYAATKGEAGGPYRVVIEVKKPGESDTGCRVAYSLAPQNGQLSQAQINDMANTPERVEVIKATLGRIYDVVSVDPFEHAGVRGAAIVADFKLRPGIPERAKEIRSHLFLLETPKERLSIVCVGEKKSFDARKGEFEAVARGTTLPK